MSDVWLLVEASFPNLQARDILRRFVKPIVDEFNTRFVTFHFFFERQFLLRLKAEQELLTETIIPFVDRKLTELSATNQSVRVDTGYTEESDYGDGWELAQRIFEVGSRSAISGAEAEEGNLSLGPQFNEGKFVHLLLNQWGRSIVEEALFHFDRVAERLEVHYSRGNLDLVNRKHPQIMEELHNTFAQPIAELVRRRIADA